MIFGLPSGDQTPAIACLEVDLVIAGHQILSGVTLDVARGEFVAVIGPNGAGKTSLINVLSGATAASRGTVTLEGTDVSSWPAHKRARAGLGRTFQTSNLLLGRSVLENVRVAANARNGFGRASLCVATSRDPVTHAALRVLEQVGLRHCVDDLASSLSHGDQRKLELAMVLAQGSSVILLDEPMAGVASSDVESLVRLIRAVHLEEGKTVLMVEHHMSVVLDLAQRLAVMHHGALLAVGSPAEIIANETVQTAYVGEAL